ncbi:MAG TPA: hypothetical protein HA252_01465 [Candidatus Diapherotrites archaeon]|uniref:Uncharacterized protein n=1 Tax=Candidatus Iainarchaeum sp. TaxID=3101447 RepID=A0A7J4JE85_9ARCH|nr:hypothetical protein [Candidatus Diapherotrites archaeon]HIH16053.1 hypothetical protein [Candidatus Diapherotrites archaeon]
MSDKKKYRKGIASLDRRIAEHREKQCTTRNPKLFHYWEKEIEKFKREKRKKAKWL